MGAPMAGHLARAGHEVVVYNRTASRAEAWVAEHGGRAAATPAAAAEGARFVFACTGADADLRAITLGRGGAFRALAPGAVFVDHTTASPDLARELAAAAAARGAAFLDAPVSGGQDGARRGALTVMAGGDPAALERARPLLAAFAKNVTWMGPAGAGQLTKLVNQICLAGLIQSLAEGLAFAERAGLDAAPRGGGDLAGRRAVLADGPPRPHDARGPLRLRLRGGLDAQGPRARPRGGGELPAPSCRWRSSWTAFYAELQRAGGGRLDSSSLVTRLRRE